MSHTPSGKTALLMLDLINEIVHPDGKYGRDGYASEVRRRGVLGHAARALEGARRLGLPVIHVVVGFTPDYAACSPHSAVLTVAREDRRLLLGTWATEIHPDVAPLPGEPIVVKQRVSAFHQTHLELLLRAQGIQTLLLAGVSTEFVVLATALEAHDRDLHVVVLEDATSALTPERHEAAVQVLRSTAQVSTVAQALDLNPRKAVA